MKVLYVTKQLPFAETEAFILPEIASHAAQGWDVWLSPTQSGPLVHEDGKRLLSRTLYAWLLAPRVLLSFIAGVATQPAKTLGWGIRAAGSGKLAIRNLAVWPKGVWLGRQAKQLGIDHIHIHWCSVPATMGMIAADIAGVPFSITAHRYDIAQGNMLVEKARRATFIRAIDQDGADEIAAQIVPTGVKPWLLRMGVKLSSDAAPLREGILSPLRLVMAARFVEKKGHHVLFEAVNILRRSGLPATVDLFGGGPLAQALEAAVESRGLKQEVRFKGVLDHKALLAALLSGDYDIAVLPSLVAGDKDKEGIPVFLMEAMGAGLPTVSTPNGGIRELAEGDSCLLVPERDAEALAAALEHLARDADARLRLAAAGRRKVSHDFEIEACMGKLRQAIEDSVKTPGAAQ